MSGGYLESEYPFPVCNHTEEIDEANIGYTCGMFSCCIPFEAELWQDDEYGTKHLTIVIPEELGNIADALAASGEPPRRQGSTTGWKSALTIGMIDREIEGTQDEHDYYMFEITYAEIIKMRGDRIDILLRYLTDLGGNNVVALDITLERNGIVFADTELNFRSFPRTARPTPPKPQLHIVK